MNEKIIFLDIDGVLMSGKAFILPSNINIMDKIKGKKHSPKDTALQLTFDPIAVALLNRLCDMTQAKIVIISNWRRNIGRDKTKEKLIEQGINKDYFHTDFYCPHKLTSDKIHDLDFWLDEHRTTPTPEFDFDVGDDIETRRRKNNEYHTLRKNYGIDYLIIDDENIHGYGITHECQLQTDYHEGFSAEEYRVAVGFFQCEDRAFDVFSVDKNTLDKIKKNKIFDNQDQMFLTKWLYSLRDNPEFTAPRACLLSYKAVHLDNYKSLDLSLFGISTSSTRELYLSRSNSVLCTLKDD